MYFTGFADEASTGLAGQIKATKELGWKFIESRNIDGKNIHDLSDAEFDKVVEQLEASGVGINCFGSAIANWAKKITDPMTSSIEETQRAIPRMQRLGTKLVRIMSFAVLPDRGPEDQMEEERFKRVRELVAMFTDAGITPVHENCMNYGGMGYGYTLKLIENVPGLKLVFDTGNPVFTDDRMKPAPYPKQSAWEFYKNVKEHIAYIHIKDGIMDGDKMIFGWCGEGDGDVKKIVKDALASGYDGGISIEPHVNNVFHEAADETITEEEMFKNYVEYGRRMMKIVDEIKSELA